MTLVESIASRLIRPPLSNQNLVKAHLQNPLNQLMVCLFLVISMGLYLTWMVFRDLPRYQEVSETVAPSEVIKEWAKTFPHTPNLAVVLTTKHFRDGRSPDDWVEDVRQAWPQIQFRYRTGQVQSGWTEGDTALVIFEATSSSIWGKHDRREEYRLIKNLQGQWLIDQFRLVNDQVF